MGIQVATGYWLERMESDLNSVNANLSLIEGTLTNIETSLGASLETLVTDTNTKLDTIHADLDTTLAGKLDTLHSDLDTTIAGLLTLANGYLDGLEGLITATNTAIASTNTKLDTANGHLSNIATDLSAISGQVKKEYEVASYANAAFAASSSNEYLSTSGPGTLIGHLHLTDGQLPSYQSLEHELDGVDLDLYPMGPLDIAQGNALGVNSVGWNREGQRISACFQWNTGSNIYEIRSGDCVIDFADTLKSTVSQGASGGTVDLTVETWYHVWTSTQDIVIELKELPEVLIDFRKEFKRSFPVINSRWGFIRKGEKRGDKIKPKLIISIADKHDEKVIKAILKAIKSNGVDTKKYKVI